MTEAGVGWKREREARPLFMVTADVLKGQGRSHGSYEPNNDE